MEVREGVVKVAVDEHKSIWKNRLEKLMNVENEWEDCVDHPKVEGPVSMIGFEELDSYEAHEEREGEWTN